MISSNSDRSSAEGEAPGLRSTPVRSISDLVPIEKAAEFLFAGYSRGHFQLASDFVRFFEQDDAVTAVGSDNCRRYSGRDRRLRQRLI